MEKPSALVALWPAASDGVDWSKRAPVHADLQPLAPQDTEALTAVYTSDDAWALQVLQELVDHVGDLRAVRVLGFCVSVAHARFMARRFRDAGVAAVAVTGETPVAEREAALKDLEAGRVQVVFSVDLFNEGVDVPTVDTLLLLRPTDSPVLFLQQLGRGLRRVDGKSVCTVLDFVANHRREFRFDRIYRALFAGTRAELQRTVRDGFPFLPSGCSFQLDPVARERVLDSIRSALP